MPLGDGGAGASFHLENDRDGVKGDALPSSPVGLPPRSSEIASGPAPGLRAFFAHRIHVRDDTDVQMNESSGAGCKRHYGNDDTPVCNGAAAAVSVDEESGPLAKRARVDGSDEDVSARMQVAEEAATFYKKKAEDVTKASTRLTNALTASLANANQINVLKDRMIEGFKEAAVLRKLNFDKVAADHRELISIHLDRIKNLQIHVKAVTDTIALKDDLLSDAKDEHENTVKKIKDSVNEMRYVTEIGSSSKKAQQTCPVSTDLLLPSETVVMVFAECECNCMIKYDCAQALIKSFDNGDAVKCMLCRSAVTSIKVTTTKNAEKLFAWRDVEAYTECNSVEDVYKQHATIVERLKAETAHQDTHKIRKQLESISAIIAHG
ncbi:hypothetical protein T484DRAFT_1754342 [Baffinella frigidus]|nr:hypothetical protein T484DRAFT_1754342 [Cryptophyta sp. CCMP2293]